VDAVYLDDDEGMGDRRQALAAVEQARFEVLAIKRAYELSASTAVQCVAREEVVAARRREQPRASGSGEPRVGGGGRG
jgi:hypothetical protein